MKLLTTNSEKCYRMKCEVSDWISSDSIFIPKKILETLEWKPGEIVVLDAIKSGVYVSLRIEKDDKS